MTYCISKYISSDKTLDEMLNAAYQDGIQAGKRKMAEEYAEGFIKAETTVDRAVMSTPPPNYTVCLQPRLALIHSICPEKMQLKVTVHSLNPTRAQRQVTLYASNIIPKEQVPDMVYHMVKNEIEADYQKNYKHLRTRDEFFKGEW